jgi:sucrose phosphorylase
VRRTEELVIRNQVQLITYPDSLGGTLTALQRVVEGWFPEAAMGGIHILPPFPSSADRGFAPTTYEQIDPRFGTWDDIRRLGKRHDIVVDLMVNHISRQSQYFQDFMTRGRRSAHADLFITLDKVWQGGVAPREEVERIFLRKPDHPFSEVRITQTGEIERVWTSFGARDWSEQIDLDVASVQTRRFLTDTLARFSRMGIRAVRLDAVGYVIKKAGTTCFMVEPDIYEFLDWLKGVATPLGLELLPEIHANQAVQQALTGRGYWTYDFVLPLLVLATIMHRSSSRIRSYLEACSRHRVTMLDCHDGIPVQPDLDDVLPLDEARDVVRVCLDRGANLNRILSDGHVGSDGFDVHQINTTYYSALGCNDDAYLAARAIQFFAPGIPQVYYVGLLAGKNDAQSVQETGEGRAVNRHNYSMEEVDRAIRSEVVQRLLRLIRFRNTHPGFGGGFSVEESADEELVLSWKSVRATCRLSVDLNSSRARIVSIEDGGSPREIDV